MNYKKIKFIFCGTPDIAVETLNILKKNNYKPSLIITVPDKPFGRGMNVLPPPVKTWAIKNKIPCLQVENPSLIPQNEYAKYDLMIVVAYGKIFLESAFNAPRLGSINIHYSLLPKYKGPSPVESALLNDEDETGVTIQKIALKIDSGPILAQKKINIKRTEKASELQKRLIRIGGELLVSVLPKIIDKKIKPIQQNESEAIYCCKINKTDGLVDLNHESPRSLYNKFRAFDIWPKIFYWKDNKRIIITDAVLENGKFIIKKVTPEGKKEQEFNPKIHLPYFLEN